MNDRLGDADPYQTAHAAAHTQRRDGLRLKRQHAPGLVEQRGAERRERRSQPPFADKQSHAVFRFQRGYPRGDGRLRGI